MPKKQVINLLPQEEFQKSPIGRTLHWATTTFRTIVIITELVVIIAFLSRFWLDARNADLNDVIRQNQSIIESYKEFETQFRQTQQRIKIFSGLSESTSLSSVIGKVVSLIPEDIKLVSVSESQNTIQIKAASASQRSIVQFITNLGADPTFGEIKVTNAQASSENQAIIVFTLESKLSKGGGS